MGKLKRELGWGDVFSFATGAMISSGLFVLPAIAFRSAGPAVIISYLLASIIILPSVLSKAELATAMPRAGGTYFFVERSLGPASGLFTGFANWFSLAMKSAFALIGIAVFGRLIIDNSLGTELGDIYLKVIAIVFCVIFATANILSVKYTSRFQVILVATLLGILLVFFVLGSKETQAIRYQHFWAMGWRSIFATAGLVFISYGGLTKAASIAEEVKHPGRNLPLGMIMAWLVTSAFYIGVVVIIVGVVDKAKLESSLTPVSDAAGVYMGKAGFALLGVAAMAAFITTANAGIMAAARSPMAMSRDQLLPVFLAKINKKLRTPVNSIILTAAFMIAAIAILDIETLVKVASTLMIILFILDNASVIIMRQSGIQSYRPMFKSPGYPYVQIFAIVVYAILLVDMGTLPLTISFGFVGISAGWYFLYVKRRVGRQSALMHVVERVTDKALKTVTLESELRDILIERDNIIEDRFDKLIRQCEVVDLGEATSSDEIFKTLSQILSGRLKEDENTIFEKFHQRESEGTTIVQPGLAIPHIIVEGENKFEVVLVRAREGISFAGTEVPVKTMFVLAGSKDERNYHLRALMAIAQIAQEKDFTEKWLAARDTESIKNLLLLSNRTRQTK